MDRARGRLTYANVMSTIGVALALGGTSYAAVKLPANSVGSAQIKANAVKASEIATNAVTSAEIKSRSLLATDFAPGQIPTGATGATGATGLQGTPGLQGPAGPSGVVGAITVQRTDFTVPEPAPPSVSGTVGLQVECPPATKVIGGGAALDDTSAEGIYLTVSRPFRLAPGAEGDKPVDGETFDSWGIAYRNAMGMTGTTTGSAWAVCAQT
jgi:hypothetical protein